ncbi:MAG: outer membrane beta-barrel protein [Bacteroidota bacterium]
MKKYAFLLIILYAAIISSGQKIQVTGQVKDAKNRDPLEFSTISVFSAKDSLITGSVTNQKGYYSLELMPGVYKFVHSFIGYISDTSALKSVTGRVFLGVIQLMPDVNQLNEVNVKTSSSEVQIDRDVQIVTDKMKEGASTTKDVLEKVNGVTYDRYNNSVKVDNDSKVIILVDGIEKDQEYVKNLTPERLKKIEVIRDPGGRYGLEGYSAVINVILKKDYRGTEIYASERLMLDVDAPKTSYIPVQNGTSLTLSYIYNKVNTYAKFSNNTNKFHLQSRIDKEYGDSLSILSRPEEDGDMNLQINQMYNSYVAGADFFINPKNTFSSEAGLTLQPYKYNHTGQNDMVTVFANQLNLDPYFTSSELKTGSKSFYNSLYYEAKPDENNIINTNFIWSTYNDQYRNFYNESSLYQRLETGTNQRISTKYYLEYTHVFNSNHSIQAGYGNTWQDSRNTYTVEELSKNFTYSDFRNKLYGYYSWQPSKKFGIKAGCAGETSQPVSGIQNNSYFSVNPYGDIKYKPIDILSIKLKYRAATRYPGISETNPFTYIVDQQSVRIGNPLLKPEVTNKLSVQVAVLEGLFSIEPYFHFSNNMIAETGRIRDDGIFEYSSDNLGNYTNKGIESHITIPFSKSLILKNDLDYYRSSVEYAGHNHNLNDIAMTNQFIYIRNKSNTVIGLQYQNNLRKFITAQGYQKGDNDFWIVFVQQPFMKQRLTVMVLYFLPINWGCDFYQGGYISTTGYTETKNYDISLLKNMLMFEVSYRFNKGKSVTRVDKKVEEESGNKPKKLF